MPAILIAGTHSGCGKTTVTLGILAALRKKGLVVQPFKTGPDFIDAGLHRLAAGKPSRNLDVWMCGQEYVADCFRRQAAKAEIAVIEGVMGMHDGAFSSAHLANLLHAAVLLVVDAFGMAESAGAIVRGFAEFETRNSLRFLSREGEEPADKHNSIPEFGVQSQNHKVQLAGIIFNRVASKSHYTRLKDSVRDVPVLGYLPRELGFEIPHRHLGLTVAEEDPLTDENIQRLADTVLSHIDIDVLIQKAGDLDGKEYKYKYKSEFESYTTSRSSRLTRSKGFKLAVAYDKAFNFYYEDNLDLLENAGADIIRFSPLADPGIPDRVDAVYIGGGYPEIHSEALARNTSMLSSVRAWADAARPLYAECGGLMYLSQGIFSFEDNFYNMAGVFPFKTRMMKKPRLAYREIVLNKDCILGTQGQKCRGHEFHYSDILHEQTRDGGRGEKIYSVRDKNGLAAPAEGFRIKNTLASYIHIHFGSNKSIAEHFADFVKGENIG